MKFGEAIEAVKKGKRIGRTGMLKKSEFVFMQVPSEIPAEIVPKMQSLPQSVKNEFVRRFVDPTEQINSIYYNNQLAIVSASNVITGWAPSADDTLADDWFILE